jgi:hypothetical protein
MGMYVLYLIKKIQNHGNHSGGVLILDTREAIDSEVCITTRKSQKFNDDLICIRRPR